MKKEIKCSKCSMVFSESTRLERHVKKAHPNKRKVGTSQSSDFNHAHMSFTHF